MTSAVTNLQVFLMAAVPTAAAIVGMVVDTVQLRRLRAEIRGEIRATIRATRSDLTRGAI